MCRQVMRGGIKRLYSVRLNDGLGGWSDKQRKSMSALQEMVDQLERQEFEKWAKPKGFGQSLAAT